MGQLQFRACQLTGGEESEGFFDRTLKAITSSVDECAGFFIIYKIFDNCSFELCQLTGGEESAGFFSGLSRQLCRPGMSARVF